MGDRCLSLLLSCKGLKSDFRTFITRYKADWIDHYTLLGQSVPNLFRVHVYVHSNNIALFVHTQRCRPTVHSWWFYCGCILKIIGPLSRATKLYGCCKTINKSIVYSDRGCANNVEPHESFGLRGAPPAHNARCKPMMGIKAIEQRFRCDDESFSPSPVMNAF